MAEEVLKKILSKLESIDKRLSNLENKDEIPKGKVNYPVKSFIPNKIQQFQSYFDKRELLENPVRKEILKILNKSSKPLSITDALNNLPSTHKISYPSFFAHVEKLIQAGLIGKITRVKPPSNKVIILLTDLGKKFVKDIEKPIPKAKSKQEFPWDNENNAKLF